jgi:hypothetical protein
MLGYRILLGAVGSVAIIAAMHEIKCVHKYIGIVGASTAGIYILQTYILQKGMGGLFEQYVDLSRWPMACNYAMMVVISIVLTIIITWLYQVLKKSPMIDMLLFGNGDMIKRIVNKKTEVK